MWTFDGVVAFAVDDGGGDGVGGVVGGGDGGDGGGDGGVVGVVLGGGGVGVIVCQLLLL